jgi:hypothetical protein
MNKLLSLGIAAIACAAIFATTAPTAAKASEYCRRDITGYTLGCGYDTLAQCQAMSSGRGGDCLRNPALEGTAKAEGAANAYAYAPIARKHHHQ